MYVACPSCKTLFRIQAEHLQLAGGQVRCGTCRTAFSAAGAAFEDPQQALACVERTNSLADDIDALISRALERVPSSDDQASSGAERGPAEQREPERADVRGWSARSPRTGAGPATASARAPVARDLGMPVAEEDGEPAPERGDAVDAMNDAGWTASQPFEWSPAPPDELPQTLPSADADGEEEAGDGARGSLSSDVDLYAQPLTAEFVASRSVDEAERADAAHVLLLDDVYREGVSGRAWGAIAASLLLAGLLVVQYGFAERDRLAALPQLRPALEFGCQHLGCDLPPRRDVAQVEILERQVRDHPGVDDALLINVSFANRADFVQAFPLFEVSFSDVSGTPVAVGRFKPDEYLPESRRGSRLMQPGEHAQLMLEVIDPGERAVSFQFDFL